MPTDNPFSAPVTESSTISQDALTDSGYSTRFGVIAKPVFLAWERLRVVYVVVLGLLTVLITGSSLLRAEVLVTVVQGALFANVCYLAGPLVETYVRWLGYPGSWVRWFLFVAGTLFTAGGVLVVLGAFLLPTPI